MSIKHILVPLSGDRHTPHVPLCALKLAQRLVAHVTVTDTVGDSSVYIDPGAAGMVPEYYEEIQQSLDKAQAHKRDRARKSFDDAVAMTKVAIVDRPTCAGPSTYWIDGSTMQGMAVKIMGRLADLIVIDRPGEEGGVAELQALEAAVFVVRRPVLVVPDGVSDIGKTVAVAWNGSVEAADAVTRALDLLEPGSVVTIIQVGEIRPTVRNRRGLLWLISGGTGSKQTCAEVADQPKATGKLILETAKAAGAGLLIMGAYTHSRLREMLLGGVTDHMLKKADIPLLLAH